MSEKQSVGSAVKVPKYYLVKTEILSLIGDLPPGAPMPTERELAARFGTSRTTVRQAIAELIVDGRLAHTQGSGTFVAQPKLMAVRPLSSFSQDLREDGWQPGSQILDVSEVPAPLDAADQLQVEPGQLVQRVERIRTAGEEPIAHEVAYLPMVHPDLAEQLAEHESLYRTLRESYGIAVDTAEDTIETALADPATANLLDVETGLPMLVITRTAWDAAGNTVEWSVGKFRGDRFRFITRHA